MHARPKRIALLVCVTIACLAIVGALAANSLREPAKQVSESAFYPAHVAGEVLIKFKPGTGPNEHANVRAQIAAERLQTFRSGAEHWRLGGARSTEQAIAQLRGNPHVQYVEPNYIVQAEVAPNDARYGELWGMNNTGQTGGTAGADIDAERAWNVSTGSHDVVVAVIDTGVDYNHPDLAANIWTNPGEIAGNGVDDDNNGFIDDVHGWDFYNNDSDPFDDNGHGTHCSGTIGGVGDNGIGVAGVNWHVTIMGVKFLSGGGSGTTAGAVASVDYATMMGVDIMSNSWGGGGFSQALLDAINGAAAAEIVFVAAAGNSNANNDTSPHYPSSYDAPNVIAVAATDHNDNKASFSSYGATSVDLGAPGVNTLSTLPGNSYGLLSGTSMATPHVSGAAALLRAVAPNTSAALVRQILMNFSDPIPAMAGITVSGGRLNAFFPIAEPDDVPPGQITDLAFSSATSNSIFLGWTATGDDGEVGTASDYDLRYSTAPIDDANFAMATQATGLPAPEPSGTPQSGEILGLQAGMTYYFAMKAEDEWGNIGPLSNVAMGTTLPPPTFASSPDSFSADLLTGQTATRTLTIQNAGVGTLDWTIPLPEVSGPVAAQYEPLDLGKDDPDPRPGVPALDGFGGPDNFGYRWIDSNEAGGPAFSWTDIAMTGTPVAIDGDDQNGGPIPIGFGFPFYGTTFDAVRVSTNGWISFTSTATSYSNQPLPNSGAPENLIAAFWDDLHFRSAQRATYANVNGAFVVQFTEVDRYSTGSSLTFQIELQPSGEIRLRYLSMVGVLDNATVGIQNATKDDGLTVTYNAAYLQDNLEIRIAAVPQWVTASPTSGRLYAGESADVTVTIDATGLDGGTYEGSVNVGSNDPTNPVVGHPVTLTVTGAPAISVAPLSIDFGQIYFGFSDTRSITINNTGTDALTVSSIDSGDPQVTVSPAQLSIPAHTGATVEVTYTPAAPSTMGTTLTINSDASNDPLVLVAVAGYSLPAPALLTSPASFSEQLYTGGTVTRNLRLRNTGGSDLLVDLSVELGATTARPPAEPAPELPKGDDSDAGTGDNVIEREGGPDAFGYRYKDSDAPGGPTFDWVDISGVGTRIPFSAEADDANVGPFPIGFDFSFYGNTFTTFRASTNGFLSFTSTSSDLSNSTLPGTGSPENLLAVFHDDLRFYGAANNAAAYYHYDGSRLIVQYQNVSKYGQSSTSLMNFEIILYPSGKIVYQYLDMSGTLNSATVGMQNATRDVGLQVSYNENYVHNNMAIEFARIPDWLSVSPASATIPPGGFRDFQVAFNAGDSGDRLFQGGVRIDTNIPDPPFVVVPATLRVFGVADVATAPESVDYGQVFTGYPHLVQLAVQNVGTGDLTVNAVTSSDPSLFVEEPPAAGGTFVIAPGDSVLYNLRWLPAVPSTLDAVVTVHSDDPDEPTLQVPVIGTAVPAPILGYSPGSYSEALFVGEALDRSLTLTNSGGSDLEFQIGVNLTNATVVQDRSPELPKGVDPIDSGAPQILGSGGPDMFGYRWKDSDEAGGPAFQWVDISATGTPAFTATGDDRNFGPFPIGFDFPFYGTPFSEFRICSNGWVSFTSTSTDLSNSLLPGTGSPENLLAAFHDDLVVDLAIGGNVYYENDGSRLIVQYDGVRRFGTSNQYTFQILLYPSGKIVYQYLTMQGDRLDEATIGIQNATQDDGLTVAYNQDYVHDNLAVAIQAAPDWLSVGATSGVIPPGGSMEIPVRFDATEIVGGIYSGGLRLTTNDPARALVSIPATLMVTGYPAIAAAPASLDFGTVFVGVSSSLQVSISNPGSDVLNVTNVAISGDYTTDTSPFSLAPGAARVLDVSFAPTTDGTRAGQIDFTSNATGVPLFSVALTGDGLFPPVADPEPEDVAELVEEALPPGGSKVRTLRLYNNGQSDLAWTASATLNNEEAGASAPPPVQTAVELPKGDDSADGTGWQVDRAGGPDDFGYRYRDSDETGGPVFDWFDIRDVGTPVAGLDGDDETSGPHTLPFNFPYYGNTFNQIWFSTNGWMAFSQPSSSSLVNYPMPNTSGQRNMLAPFWDDLDFEGVEHATTYYDGTRFIVQYTEVEHYPGGAGTTSYTFQVILYPSGRIVYQYLSVNGNLTSHSIGIQDQSETVGLGVTYNENPPYVHDALALEFYSIPEWLTIDPTSGVIPAGGWADITVTINAAGLEPADYAGMITILTNDPFNPRVDVPVTLHVSQVALTYINVDPNTLNLSSNGNTVKAVLQLPADLDPMDVVIETVSIGGVVFANPSPIAYGDENGDGIMELVVKFDRAAFQGHVPEGESVPVTITGEVRDTTWFTGTDYIRAIHPRVTSPNGGNYLISGRSATLSWSAPVNGTPSAYDVWLSRDGGETWEVVVSGLRSNQYVWTIGGPATGQALVRVFALDSQGVMGFDTSDAVFTIADALYPPAHVGSFVMSRSGGDVTFNWKAPIVDTTHGPATQYRILWSNSAQGPFAELATTTAEQFVEPIAAHANASLVFYRVIAVNASGEAQ